MNTKYVMVSEMLANNTAAQQQTPEQIRLARKKKMIQNAKNASDKWFNTILNAYNKNTRFRFNS